MLKLPDDPKVFLWDMAKLLFYSAVVLAAFNTDR